MTSDGSIFRSPGHLRALLLVFGAALLGVQLVAERPGSYDLISYIAAADVFVGGGNPYGADILNAARYEGLPFVYPPASLWVFVPLAWIPTKVALLLDGVARLAALAWAIAAIHKRYLPSVMREHVLFAALAFAPVINAIVQANFVIYCFAAFIGCVELSEMPRSRRALAAAALCGFVMAFKPMWLIAGAFVLLARHRLAPLGGWLAGASLLGLGSVLQWELFTSWLVRVGELRETFQLADLPTLSPMLYVALVIAWLVGTGVLWVTRREHPALALHAATSVLIWPRCDIHTHLIVLWLAAWVWQTRGLKVSTLLSFPLLLPLPFVLRALGIESLADGFGLYPEILGYYVGTLLLALPLWSTLRDGATPRHQPRRREDSVVESADFTGIAIDG